MYDPNRPADELWLECDCTLLMLEIATGYMSRIFVGDGFETGESKWFFQQWISTNLDDIPAKCRAVRNAAAALCRYFQV